jgi:hypothetical protein
MLLFALTGNVPPILEFLYKAWWFSFVLITHVFGYLVFRVWIARRRGAGARP